MSCVYAISAYIFLFATCQLDESQNGPAEKTAIAEMKKLGAIVGKIKIANRLNADEKVRYVILTKEWKGGDVDLKYVEQITNVQLLILVGSVEISDARLKELTKATPRIAVTRRKTDAMLGITRPPGCPSEQTGVPIGRVAPNAAAAKAGLLPGDLITQFDDKPVTNWDEFLGMMDAKKAGDEVGLVITRDGKSMDVKATLESWFTQLEERE